MLMNTRIPPVTFAVLHIFRVETLGSLLPVFALDPSTRVHIWGIEPKFCEGRTYGHACLDFFQVREAILEKKCDFMNIFQMRK